MNARARWIMLVVLGLAAVGFLISHGHTRSDEPPAPEEPTSGAVSFPMPKQTPGKAAAERALGLYVLEGPTLRFSLELRSGSAFHFVSSQADGPSLDASGTWSLAGTRLTLAYTRVTSRPEITPEKPEVAVNLWLGKTIELKDTGLKQRVVLTKRTALRRR